MIVDQIPSSIQQLKLYVELEVLITTTPSLYPASRSCRRANTISIVNEVYHALKYRCHAFSIIKKKKAQTSCDGNDNLYFGLLLLFFFSFLRQKADKPTPKHRRRLTTWQVFRQVERRFHSRDSNRQPLPWELGTLASYNFHYFTSIVKIGTDDVHDPVAETGCGSWEVAITAGPWPYAASLFTRCWWANIIYCDPWRRSWIPVGLDHRKFNRTWSCAFDTTMIILLLLLWMDRSGVRGAGKLILATPGPVFEFLVQESFCKEGQCPGSQIYSCRGFRSLKRLRWFHDGIGYGIHPCSNLRQTEEVRAGL